MIVEYPTHHLYCLGIHTRLKAYVYTRKYKWLVGYSPPQYTTWKRCITTYATYEYRLVELNVSLAGKIWARQKNAPVYSGN